MISAPANHSIRLNFTIFQLDSLSSWKPTYIEAYNGKNESSTLLGKFTGTRGHFTVWTNGRFLLIKLTKGYKYSLCNFKSVFATSKSKGEFHTVASILHLMSDMKCTEFIRSNAAAFIKFLAFPMLVYAAFIRGWRLFRNHLF